MIKKEWLRNIEKGISKYKNDVVPLINNNEHGMAYAELQNVILILNLTTKEMEQDEFCSKILVLSSRLEFLSKACANEYNTGNNKRMVEYGFNLVGEQIKIVEE